MSDELSQKPQNLPAALLCGWDGRGGATLAAARAAVGDGGAERPGVRWLREDLCAVVPVAGDAAVYDVALHVARELVDAAARAGEGDRLGLLVVSGRVAVEPDGLHPESERLLKDLEQRPPELGREPLWATSLVASRLEAARETDGRRIYGGPSGIRVPILAMGPEDRDAPPWRSPTLFRREVEPIRRPDVEGMVGGPAGVDTLRVTGPMGCGKTRAVRQALGASGAPVIWATARQERHRGPSLAAQIVHDLSSSRWRDRSGGRGPEAEELVRLGVLQGSERPRLLDPDGAPPSFADAGLMAERIGAWLGSGPAGGASRGAAQRPVIVLDDLHAACARDLELVVALSETAGEEGAFRLILIHRQGEPAGGPIRLPEAPEIRVPPMEPEEMERFRRAACKGLSLPEEVSERLLAEAAGHPFAFEEGLTALAERDLVREIHGSLFFRGDRDIRYASSRRLVQHVEAEVRRLGDPTPVRMLALAGEPVPDDRVRAAVREAGGDAEPDWAVPFLEAGLLAEAVGPWGPGMVPACPAWGEALRSVLQPDDRDRLRRSLGEVLADQTASGSWRTYQMLAGSGRAVASLLSAARDRKAPPRELLAALRTELARHRSSGGDAETELELLWAMLPLAHREEGLADSHDELERALELASDDPRKVTAFAGLQAELAEDEGRLREAESILRQALHRSHEASGEQAQTQALLVLRLARLLVRRHRHEEARELLEQVIPILDREEARSLAASARFHLANVALHQNRLETAMELHAEALAARRELGRPKPVGVSLSALGRVALQMGRYPEAVACYREAEQVFQDCGEDEEASFALHGLGRAAGRMGDHVGASRPMRRALELRERRGDRVGVAIARLAVAENYLHLGRPAAALEEARRSHFDLSFVSADEPLADVEQLLGRIALLQRDQPRAKRHLTIALDGHRRHERWEGAAFDLAYLLQAELVHGDEYEISRLVAELDNVLARSPAIERREILEIRLYRGLKRLGRSEKAGPHLERAYRRLMEKTEHLPPEQRHRFLFQVPEHEEIVKAATEQGLAS